MIDTPQAVSRRRFFANLLLGVAGVLSLGAISARVLAFLSPTAPPEREVEYPVGSLEAIPDGGGTVAHLPSGHIAIERQGQEVRAFSAVCTHLGCIVRWDPKPDHVWFCPCHGGRYSRDGRVVAGPPPRPLVAVPVTVRDGQLFVRLKIRAPMDTV